MKKHPGLCILKFRSLAQCYVPEDQLYSVGVRMAVVGKHVSDSRLKIEDLRLAQVLRYDLVVLLTPPDRTNRNN